MCWVADCVTLLSARCKYKTHSYIKQSHYYKNWSGSGAGLYYVLVSYDTV